MAWLAGDLDIKLVCAIFDQCIDRSHDLCKVHGRRCVLADAGFAVKVQKIRAFRQGFATFTFDVLANVMFAGVKQAVAIFAFDAQRVGFFQTGLKLRQVLAPAAWATRMASSSLHEGAHTACDLPSTLRVPINERARCLPHMKHDMVAAPNEVVAANGDPETLDL